MTELFPTPTRLALLAEVFAGEVWQQSNGHSIIEQGTRTRKVTAEIAAMERAGWITLVALRFGAKRWDLTDAGRAVLAAAGKD